jgi:hypothetical protein
VMLQTDHITYDIETMTAKHPFSTRRGRALRAAKLMQSPLCEPCKSEGKRTPAVTVHHIKPFKTHPELAYATWNFLSVCEDHHKRDARRTPQARNRPADRHPAQRSLVVRGVDVFTGLLVVILWVCESTNRHHRGCLGEEGAAGGWNKNGRFGVVLSVVDLAPNAARLMKRASAALVTSPVLDLSSNGEAGHVRNRSRPWDVYRRVLRAAHRGSLCSGSAGCRRVERSPSRRATRCQRCRSAHSGAACARASARERPQLIEMFLARRLVGVKPQ